MKKLHSATSMGCIMQRTEHDTQSTHPFDVYMPVLHSVGDITGLYQMLQYNHYSKSVDISPFIRRSIRLDGFTKYLLPAVIAALLEILVKNVGRQNGVDHESVQAHFLGGRWAQALE